MIVLRVCLAWGMIGLAAIMPAMCIPVAAFAETATETANPATIREDLYARATELWHEESCREAAPLLMRLHAGNPHDAIGREAMRLIALCAGDTVWRRRAAAHIGYDSNLGGGNTRRDITPESGSHFDLLIRSLRAANPENADAVPGVITLGTKAVPGMWAGASGVLHRRRHAGGGTFRELRLEGDVRLASREGHGAIGAGITRVARTHHAGGRESSSRLTLSARHTGRGKGLRDVQSHSLGFESHVHIPAPRAFTVSAGGRVNTATSHSPGRTSLSRGEVIFGLVHAPAQDSRNPGWRGMGARFEVGFGNRIGNDGYGDASLLRYGIGFGPLALQSGAIDFGAVAERLDYEKTRPWLRHPHDETLYGLYARLTYPLGQGLPMRVVARMTIRESGDALDSGRKWSLEAEFPF